SLSETVANQFYNMVEPTRLLGMRILRARPCARGQKFECQTLHCQRCEVVLVTVFFEKSTSEPDQRTPLVFGRALQDRGRSMDPVQPRAGVFKIESSPTRVVPAIGVGQSGGEECEGGGPTTPSLALPGCRAPAFEDKAEEGIGVLVPRDYEPRRED